MASTRDGVVASALEIVRVEETARLTDSERELLFSRAELVYARSKRDPDRRLAARLAAKRAARRALGGEIRERESVSIEPLKRGRVELYDHQGKREFSSFEESLQHARTFLRDTLEKRGGELGLRDTRFEITEDILEDYADYSRRARKVLVIARIEATLSGMPE